MIARLGSQTKSAVRCCAGGARRGVRWAHGVRASRPPARVVVVGTGPVDPRGRRPRRPRRRRRPARRTTRSPRSAASREVIDKLAGDDAAALRHLHRLRRAGHDADPRRSAAPSCSAASSARTPPGTGPEVEREVVRALMLLRLSTLATGRTGVRPGDRARLRRDARRRHHAGRARVRLAGLLRRPRAARARRARADGRGRGAGRRRRPPARRRGARRRRASRPSSSPRRRGSPSSTAPTACSGCWCSPCTTCACC